ncbi:MAG: hypothetical protein ACK4MT_03120 [Thermaurantiacus tibetensis]|uniref:hypothetical protein n=1 Tax=Thermaurantiacus tibetensis TaxID=2759035 RepID=UPI00188E3348|nr:hypothetical protein [Thermaurantiacus tibetensis]
MAKWVSPTVLDAALQAVAAADRMVALAAQPATFAEAMAGRLAEAPMAPADFALGAGDVSGRKVTVAAKSGLPVLAGGTANHVALLDTAASRLLYVTTCPDQAVAPGGTVTIAGWAIEIADPV